MAEWLIASTLKVELTIVSDGSNPSSLKHLHPKKTQIKIKNATIRYINLLYTKVLVNNNVYSKIHSNRI
jgi:hypothetical protein